MSKAELKEVIEGLKKESSLPLVRKALKLVPKYLKSQGLTKKLLKEIVRLWAEAGEKTRVVCLLVLVRIYTKLQDKEMKQLVIKMLYNSFLDKCRITKYETMSMIGFMRHSLVEIYKLDPKMAFKQAQTSCQQLTLTLKNAITHKNEETYKTVLNWQFANCLILLTNLITSQDENSPVKSLTHQVIQLNLGAINLMHSPRYYPYYCHLIENLIDLSDSSKLFIPILPIMMRILDRLSKPSKPNKKSTEPSKEEKDDEEDFDFDKKAEDKTYDLELLNHVSLDESHTPNYTTAVIDKIYRLMVKYLANQCHHISFPELVFLPCVQLKKWIKANAGDPQFKGLLTTIKSDSLVVDEARRQISFSFTDLTAVDAWEKRMKDSGKLRLPKTSEEIVVPSMRLRDDDE